MNQQNLVARGMATTGVTPAYPGIAAHHPSTPASALSAHA